MTEQPTEYTTTNPDPLETTTAPDAHQPAPDLTSRQRNVIVIAKTIGNDMNRNGTVAEQHTAALLQLVADAVTRGYEADAVRMWGAWRREVEHAE